MGLDSVLDGILNYWLQYQIRDSGPQCLGLDLLLDRKAVLKPNMLNLQVEVQEL